MAVILPKSDVVPIDPATGKFTTVWYLFLASLQQTAGGSGDVSQAGLVTAGNLAIWSADHTIEDGGPPGPAGGLFMLLTADPAAPSDDTFWMVREGSAPTTVSLKARIGGVTYVVASMDF